MSIKKSVSVEDAINLLNELLELDAGAIGALVANRVPCNEGIADHYSVNSLIHWHDDRFTILHQH